MARSGQVGGFDLGIGCRTEYGNGEALVHHQYPSAPEIKDLRTVHASANERISRLRSRS